MLKKIRDQLFKIDDAVIPHYSSTDVRVLYQSYEKTTAFSYIDQGMVHGYEDNGAQVLLYDAKSDTPSLKKILKKFKPTHFVGFLQEVNREVTPWTSKDKFFLLQHHRDSCGMHVALRSNPTNMSEFVHSYLGLKKDILEIATDFFRQPDRPTTIEKKILHSNFVDIFRSPLHHDTFETAFANLLEEGFAIVEEPHAADIKRYFPVNSELTIPLLYIGGSWPYKLKNMSAYIDRLKSEYKDKFQVYGKGWPANYAISSVNDDEYNHITSKARISIALHEPAQVYPYPKNNGNERIFKLLAMKKFVISDNNPILNYHFDVGKEVVVAKDPEELLALSEYYLANPAKASAIASNGFYRVINEHTYAHRAKRLLDLLESKDINRQQIYKYK